MTYSHLKPGNVVRYNDQLWLVVERTRKTLALVAFDNSKARLKLTSQPPCGPPVYLADNATSYVIGLLAETY